jgi:hypothetical protein
MSRMAKPGRADEYLQSEYTQIVHTQIACNIITLSFYLTAL